MDAPLRELRGDEIEAYDRDGVICARGLFDETWIERMARAVEVVRVRVGFLGGIKRAPVRWALRPAR